MSKRIPEEAFEVLEENKKLRAELAAAREEIERLRGALNTCPPCRYGSRDPLTQVMDTRIDCPRISGIPPPVDRGVLCVDNTITGEHLEVTDE